MEACVEISQRRKVQNIAVCGTGLIFVNWCGFSVRNVPLNNGSQIVRFARVSLLFRLLELSQLAEVSLPDSARREAGGGAEPPGRRAASRAGAADGESGGAGAGGRESVAPGRRSSQPGRDGAVTAPHIKPLPAAPTRDESIEVGGHRVQLFCAELCRFSLRVHTALYSCAWQPEVKRCVAAAARLFSGAAGSEQPQPEDQQVRPAGGMWGVHPGMSHMWGVPQGMWGVPPGCGASLGECGASTGAYGVFSRDIWSGPRG